jgi:hypothetical protein
MSSPDCLPSSWVLFGRAKISGPDPLLTTVWTSYPTKPLLAGVGTVAITALLAGIGTVAFTLVAAVLFMRRPRRPQVGIEKDTR